MFVGYYRIAWFRPRRAQPNLLALYSKPVTINHYTLTADAGSYALTGQDAVLQRAGYDGLDSATGTAPDGYTNRWVTSGIAWTEDAGGYARAVVSASGRHLLAHDRINSESADIELLAKFRWSAVDTNDAAYAGLVARASGAAASEHAYAAFINTTGSTKQIRLNYYNAGTSTLITAVGFTFAQNTYYWMRFRVIGTSLKVKMWADGGAEPGSWDIDTTHSAIAAAGWNGPFAFLAPSNTDYDYFAFATNGAVAPSPPAQAYVMPADAGSYAYTGVDASLSTAYRIVADAGSYGYTGQAVQFPRTGRIVADAGAYGYTGIAAITAYGYRLVADPGSYAFIGQAVNTLYGRRASADAGSYAYTGQAATLALGYRIAADAGAYGYSGQAAALPQTGIDLFDNGAGFGPDGWTPRHVTANVSYWEEAAGYVLTQVSTAGRHLFAYDRINDYDDIEITAEIRTLVASANNLVRNGVMLRASNPTAGQETGYVAAFFTTSGGVQNFRVGKYVSGTFSEFAGTDAFTVNTNTWVRIRMRVIGNSIKARVWLATDAEPTDWNTDVTDSAITTGDWSGLWAFAAGDHHANWVGWGTDGATAPLAPTAGAYTITAEAGSYAYTGQAAALNRTYQIAADVGAYPYTGVAAGTLHAHRQVADAGAYAYTGIAAALAFVRKVIAEAGSYPYTGQPANALYARRAAADAGSYPYTGQDALLRYTMRLVADAGNYPFTGMSVPLVYVIIGNYVLDAAPTNYAYTGQDVAFPRSGRIVADAGAYAYTGIATGTFYGRRASADAGAYAYTGIAANFLYTRVIAADAGNYAYGGQAANTLRGYRLVADAGAYAYTGQDAALVLQQIGHYSMPAESGSYASTGNAAITAHGRRMVADAGAYAYTGQDALAAYGRRAAADAGAYPYSGQAASIFYGRRASADAGSYAYTGQDVALRTPATRIQAEAGSYAYTGQQVLLRRGYPLIAASGSYAYTGVAVTLIRGRAVIADAGAYAYTGLDVLVRAARRFIAEAGSYAYSGIATLKLKYSQVLLDAPPIEITGSIDLLDLTGSTDLDGLTGGIEGAADLTGSTPAETLLGSVDELELEGSIGNG